MSPASRTVPRQNPCRESPARVVVAPVDKLRTEHMLETKSSIDGSNGLAARMDAGTLTFSLDAASVASERAPVTRPS